MRVGVAVLFLLVISLGARTVAQQDDGWFVGLPLKRVNCTPIFARRHAAEGPDTATTLLRVHIVLTDGVRSMAAHLVETLVASLPEEQATIVGGICIGLHDATERDTSNGPAPFGSAEYYAVLKAKHEAFTNIIEQFDDILDVADRMVAAADRSPEMHSVRMLPWALLLDADTQVFRGWTSYIAGLLSNTSVAAHCDSNFGHGCHPLRGSNDEHIGVFFQRESKKMINSGVVLADLRSSAVRCLYRSALRFYRPSQYGDQTSIQRVLSASNRRGGWCNVSLRTADDDWDRRKQVRGAVLRYYVFHRHRVNAALLVPTLLVIQHAHMSGKYKTDHLLRSARAMNSSASCSFLLVSPKAIVDVPCSAGSACQVTKDMFSRQIQKTVSKSRRRQAQVQEKEETNGSWKVAFVVNGTLSPDAMRGGAMVRADDQVGYWWTVVPALIVLGTLTFYHCLVDKS